MSYNSFSRPRFYINSIEHLYNRGFVNYAHPAFLSSSWHRPKTVEDTTFTVDLSRSDLLSDISYIMILGNVEDNLIVSGLDIADDSGGLWEIADILDPAKGFTPMVTDTIPLSGFTFSNSTSLVFTFGGFVICAFIFLGTSRLSLLSGDQVACPRNSSGS